MPPAATMPVSAFPLISGIATNLDAMVVRPPALLALENCVWSPRGVLSKRPGCEEKGKSFSAIDPTGGTWTTYVLDSLRSLFTSRDELVAVDDDGVSVSFSSAQNRWWQQPSPATLIAPTIDIRQSIKDDKNQEHVDVAVAGNWTLHVWQTEQSAPTACKYLVTDTLSGAVLIPPTVMGDSNARNPSAVGINGILFAFYVNTSTQVLRAVRIVPGATPSTSDISIAANIRTPYSHDTEVDPTGTTFVAVAYNTATTVELETINSAGTVLNGPTAVSGAGLTVENVACSVEPNTSHIGVAWVQNSAGNRTLAAGIRQSNVTSVVLAATTVHATFSTQNSTGLTCVWEALTIGGGNYRLRILYVGDSNSWPGLVTRHASITTAGTVVTGVLGFNAHLASRAFRDQRTLYAWMFCNLISDSQQQKHILVALGGVGASASSLFHAGKYTDAIRGPKRCIVAVANDGTAYVSLKMANVVPHVSALGSRRFIMTMPTLIRSLRSSAGFDVIPTDMTVDFGTSALRAVEVNGITYLSGGVLMQHDEAAVEAGFHLYPDGSGITLAEGAGGSLTTLAQYAYIVRYGWINARGIRERSTFDHAESITLTGANNRVTLTILTLPFSLREDQRPVAIEVYRTVANPTASSQFFKITNDDPENGSGSNRYVVNDPTVATVTLVDDLSDANLILREPFDLLPTELDPVGVGHCSALATDGNRLYAAGLDDPHVVWPSMLVSGFGNGVEFNEGLKFRVDDYGGPITALAVLNEQRIIFKERAIYVSTGDGPDNTGANGQFSTPALIHSDVGCTQPATVCTTPRGVLFFSARGWCMVTQGLAVEYVGGPVELYNSKTWKAATLHPTLRQVRILSDTTPSLIYDYELNSWGTFPTTHVGTAAAAWGSSYAYAKADGTLRLEDGTFKDGTAEYSMVIATPWFRSDASLQEYMKGGRLAVLGTFYSPCRIRLLVYFDYETTAAGDIFIDATTTAPPNGPGFSVGGPFQWRPPLPTRNHFQAVRFRIEEQTLTSPALDRSVTIAEIGLENDKVGGFMPLIKERC